jgi:glutamyl-tRNA synthetase
MAPSPTGEYHIGHIRTVLYNYALAKRHGGHFILRLEDTDRNRYVEGAAEKIMDVIKRFGFDYDEGPDIGGQYKPYVQSERLDLYKKYADELVEKDKAYYCFLSEEETKELQESFRTQNKRFRSPHRELKKDEVDNLMKEGKPYVVRLKAPEDGEVSFNDEVNGEITIKAEEIPDAILLKQDGYPTYHLAVVIDDHLMEITHIMRGNDWIPSTPIHILLYEAFGWDIPKIIHLPNLKEKGEGTKLSKRYGAVFAIDFLKEGYLKDSIVNFLMFLGWSSPEERTHGEAEREIYSLDEFIDLFSTDRIQKTALVAFDRDKLIWFNKQYLKDIDDKQLAEIIKDWVNEFHSDHNLSSYIKDDTELALKVSLVKERANTLMDLIEMLEFFYVRPKSIDWEIKQLKKVKSQKLEVKSAISELINDFGEDSSTWTHEEWEEGMRNIGDKYEVKHGDVFMVLRVAVCGGPFSPPLFESLQILGKEEVLGRIN